MGAARLILIEGMIGSGKTTTATRVGDWLARQGEDVRVFCEFASDRPIRTASAGEWRRLAMQCLRDRQTTIVESSFLQNSVMPAFIGGAPARTVNAIFTRVVRQTAPAEPLLVYLRPTDIGAAITRVHRTRGEPWSSRNLAFVESSLWARRRHLQGLDAVVKLYEAWEPVVTQLYSRYPFPKIMLTDPQHDWQLALTRICTAARP